MRVHAASSALKFGCFSQLARKFWCQGHFCSVAFRVAGVRVVPKFTLHYIGNKTNRLPDTVNTGIHGQSKWIVKKKIHITVNCEKISLILRDINLKQRSTVAGKLEDREKGIYINLHTWKEKMDFKQQVNEKRSNTIAGTKIQNPYIHRHK